jgi:hypothetical protein
MQLAKFPELLSHVWLVVSLAILRLERAILHPAAASTILAPSRVISHYGACSGSPHLSRSLSPARLCLVLDDASRLALFFHCSTQNNLQVTNPAAAGMLKKVAFLAACRRHSSHIDLHELAGEVTLVMERLGPSLHGVHSTAMASGTAMACPLPILPPAPPVLENILAGAPSTWVLGEQRAFWEATRVFGELLSPGPSRDGSQNQNGSLGPDLNGECWYWWPEHGERR